MRNRCRSWLILHYGGLMLESEWQWVDRTMASAAVHEEGCWFQHNGRNVRKNPKSLDRKTEFSGFLLILYMSVTHSFCAWKELLWRSALEFLHIRGNGYTENFLTSHPATLPVTPSPSPWKDLWKGTVYSLVHISTNCSKNHCYGWGAPNQAETLSFHSKRKKEGRREVCVWEHKKLWRHIVTEIKECQDGGKEE